MLPAGADPTDDPVFQVTGAANPASEFAGGGFEASDLAVGEMGFAASWGEAAVAVASGFVADVAACCPIQACDSAKANRDSVRVVRIRAEPLLENGMLHLGKLRGAYLNTASIIINFLRIASE